MADTNEQSNKKQDEEPEIISQTDYDVKFRSDRELQEKALNQAVDIRKFEIELYWKRSNYFWAFTAIAFSGYFAMHIYHPTGDPIEIIEKKFYLLLIAYTGYIFSLTWFFANKGSKFWQENWENHVNLLEDKIIGPLYKTILQRDDNKKFSRIECIDRPQPVSVSKLNQYIGAYIGLVWVGLCIYQGYNILQHYLVICPWDTRLYISVLFLLLPYLIGRNCKTHLGNHGHYATKRNTYISSEKGKK